MKKLIALLLFSMLILSGCYDGNRYEFTGKGKEWNASYIADVYKKGENTTGTIFYKGEGTAPKVIDYKIEKNNDELTAKNISIKDGFLTYSAGSCENCYTTKKSDDISITIFWDNKSETIKLKPLR